jgi:hypothetical protein
MGKAATYLFFVLAIIIGIGVLYLIAYGIWFYWELNHNWQIPN